MKGYEIYRIASEFIAWLVVVLLLCLLFVRLQVSPSDVLRELKIIETRMTAMEAGTRDRWTKTDHITWEQEFRAKNPGLDVPATRRIKPE